MNGARKPTSEPTGRAKNNGSAAFLPIGIVFLVVAVAMIFLGATAWIAFFTMSVTFLILSMQKRTSKDMRPPGGTSQD